MYNVIKGGLFIFSIIVAMDQNKGIGYNNKMAWHLPEELKHFRTKTYNHKIVMGRKTFESVGLLENREIIVVTRQKQLDNFPNINICNDFALFLESNQNTNEEIFICGGAQIYEIALPYCRKLYISLLKENYVVDTYFPDYDLSKFELKAKQDYDRFKLFEYQIREG